jgi:hypothetical protein
MTIERHSQHTANQLSPRDAIAVVGYKFWGGVMGVAADVLGRASNLRPLTRSAATQAEITTCFSEITVCKNLMTRALELDFSTSDQPYIRLDKGNLMLRSVSVMVASYTCMSDLQIKVMPLHLFG